MLSTQKNLSIFPIIFKIRFLFCEVRRSTNSRKSRKKQKKKDVLRKKKHWGNEERDELKECGS